MFAVLEQTARVRTQLFRAKYGNAVFLWIRTKRKPPWRKIRRTTRGCAVLAPSGTILPQGVRAVDRLPFYRHLCLRALSEYADALSAAPRLRQICIIDRDGIFDHDALECLRFAGMVTVSTKKPQNYEVARALAVQNFGSDLILQTKAVQPQKYDLLLDLDSASLYRGVQRLVPKWEALLPDSVALPSGISEVDFAAALYADGWETVSQHAKIIL